MNMIRILIALLIAAVFIGCDFSSRQPPTEEEVYIATIEYLNENPPSEDNQGIPTFSSIEETEIVRLDNRGFLNNVTLTVIYEDVDENPHPFIELSVHVDNVADDTWQFSNMRAF